ncbi:MAG TPA: hypothetical protein VMV80_08155 [Anaerolineales bacterium]|nr:hypothetical protein [candidate division Zixibacteria bacterium]HUV93044.1 hypothetical protein [Anaerolineales bacterium]
MKGDPDESLSFLDEIAESPPASSRRKRRGRGDKFETGLEDVSYREAARATANKSMAGQYKRYTVYLAPEDIAHLKEVAAELELSQAETARWFFQQMFVYYGQGLRPEMEEVVVRRRLKQQG